MEDNPDSHEDDFPSCSYSNASSSIDATILQSCESTYDKRMDDIRGDNCRIWCNPIKRFNIHSQYIMICFLEQPVKSLMFLPLHLGAPSHCISRRCDYWPGPEKYNYQGPACFRPDLGQKLEYIRDAAVFAGRTWPQITAWTAIYIVGTGCPCEASMAVALHS